MPDLSERCDVSAGLDHSRVTGTLAVVGELCPQSPVRLVKSSASGETPPQLEDPAWVIERLRSAGERAIAQELGCARETVRRAIRRHEEAGHEIPNRRLGRRRIVPVSRAHSAAEVLTPDERNLIDRYRADRRSAATRDLLVERIRHAHEADAAGDHLGYEEAMFAISTVAARIAQHEQQLRRAA